ncbi:MAG: hypothetical protein QM504_01615 [Pseudomonadota bacterium]
MSEIITIRESIDISGKYEEMPDKAGLYVYKCMETEYEWTFASIYMENGALMVSDLYLGKADLESFHAGSTDLLWCKAS